MLLLKICSVLIFILGTAQIYASTTLKVIQGSHPLDEYAVGALRVAVKEFDPVYRVEVSHKQVTQTRAREMLLSGDIDVMWLASDQEAEDSLLPIRFPLLKGLLGFRICIINPKNQGKFLGINSFHDLQRFSFGQGYGWPDVGILKSNGLNVITTSKYENLFYMVEGGRFDGFPRGVLEPWVEIKAHEELGLKVDKQLLLIYELPFYLFVSPSNQKLAAKIHASLDQALDNGAYDEYFFNHPMIGGALDNARLEDRVAFRLKNPNLPMDTPLDTQKYWFSIDGLGD